MTTTNILYDHQAFEMQRFGGISRYFYELRRHLSLGTELSLAVSTNYYLHADPETRRESGLYLPERPYKWFKGWEKRWNRSVSLRALTRGDFRVFHPTYYNPYFLPHLGEKPYVITVHDMTHELFPQYFGNAALMIAWKAETIRHASRIIAISEHTKRDIVRLLAIPPERIDVVYHGSSAIRSDYAGLALPDEYLLFVGDRHGYKNFDRFLLAFRELASERRDLYLLCVGKTFKKKEIERIAELGLTARVRQYTVSDAALSQLYRQTAVFVYPSLYEGFGFPILEAYTNECPVALSRASCFPEIAGEAGAYFDPLSSESMAATIRRVLDDSDYRSRLIALGQKRLPRYTWAETARQTEAVYASLL